MLIEKRYIIEFILVKQKIWKIICVLKELIVFVSNTGIFNVCYHLLKNGY